MYRATWVRRCALQWSSAAVFAMVSGAAVAQETGDPSEPTSGAGIVPTFYEGNPSCKELGYAHSFTSDGTSGTSWLPDGIHSVTVDSDGFYVDWSSDIGIDAVIVKGGRAANSYVYDSWEAYEDWGLAAPPHRYDRACKVHEVEFCYDYELQVRKDAWTDYTRKWDWGIDKSSDVTDLRLSTGQSYDMVQYDVSVWREYTDCDFSVCGTIWVYNPDPKYNAHLQGVTDVVNGDIWADVDCGVEFPYLLGPGETLECRYCADLPDGECRENTATAEICKGSKVGGGWGTADVKFGDPSKEIDACINVWDDQYGELGKVCEDTTFEYCIDVGPYTTCGDHTFTNTAYYESCDPYSDESGWDSWDVNVSITCHCSCTLTQGYWKTHSEYGPAPYDDTWALLPDGADTLFFNSGMTWYEVWWTAPAGDFYFNLAHQYMGAYLNLLNGSMAPGPVDTAMTKSEALFNAQGAGDTTLTSAEETKANKWMTTIGNYNEGITGPGHCDE